MLPICVFLYSLFLFLFFWAIAELCKCWEQAADILQAVFLNMLVDFELFLYAIVNQKSVDCSTAASFPNRLIVLRPHKNYLYVYFHSEQQKIPQLWSSWPLIMEIATESVNFHRCRGKIRKKKVAIEWEKLAYRRVDRWLAWASGNVEIGWKQRRHTAVHYHIFETIRRDQSRMN